MLLMECARRTRDKCPNDGAIFDTGRINKIADIVDSDRPPEPAPASRHPLGADGNVL